MLLKMTVGPVLYSLGRHLSVTKLPNLMDQNACEHSNKGIHSFLLLRPFVSMCVCFREKEKRQRKIIVELKVARVLLIVCVF